ncbi:MAG: MarR family winged helix-turn-helix transcriptional regulator [Vagococcus sp.]
MSDILREIGYISRALSSISNIEFKEINLNKGQYLYVSRIYENPGIINDALAELIKVERSVVSKSVKQLEKDQLIVKKKDVKNRKIKRLFVTEKGARAYDYLKREEQYSEKQALTGITKEEQVVVLDVLKKMRHNVAADWECVRSGNKREY